MADTTKKAGPGAIGGAVIGFVLTGFAALFFVNHGKQDSKPKTNTVATVTTATTDMTTTGAATGSTGTFPIVFPGIPTETGTGATTTGQTTGTTGTEIPVPPAPIPAPPETGLIPKPPPPLPAMMVADELSTKGRRRPSNPPSVCDAYDREKAEEWGTKGNGYGYLRNRCDLIHAWRDDTQHRTPTRWLADNGYDSPLEPCIASFAIDRRLNAGDHIAVWRRDDGSLVRVERVRPDFTCEGMTCVVVGTLTGQTAEELNVNPDRSPMTIKIAVKPDSSTLDHEGYNAVTAEYHGQTYVVDVDPHAEVARGTFSVPCWRDDTVHGSWVTTAGVDVVVR